MYNTQFQSQMEKFHNYLFGNKTVDAGQASDEAHASYSLPESIKLIPCKQDTNGEFVAPISGLEKELNENH